MFQEMLHYRNGLGEKELDPIIVEGFEKGMMKPEQGGERISG